MRRLAGLGTVVVSIGKLAAGQADYYLDQAQRRVDRASSVGSGVEDYYASGGEAPGYWVGAGSGGFGVSGVVSPSALRRVLEGRWPDSGDPVVPPRSSRVPGFDVTFSAPKSVSVLFGLGDEGLRRTIRTAHDAAVEDALGYLERVAARGRRRHGGSVTIEGRGLVAAAFRHRTSRAGDPQLHTHVLIANLVEGVDGRWSALDGRGLYQHGKTAGYLFEAALRKRLTERLGVRWGEVRNGIAEIDGVPAPVLRAFSRRRAEVEAELARRGDSSAAAARMATLATRRRKDYGVVPGQLVVEWRERAARLGFDRSALRAALGRERTASRFSWPDVFARLASPTGLTHRRATFARRDVLQALAEAVPPASVGVEALEQAADRFLGSKYCVPVIGADDGACLPAIRRRDGRLVYSLHVEGRYSTPELLGTEREVIETATCGRRIGAGAVDRRVIDRVVRGLPALSDEQLEMARRLTSEGDRVAVVLGQAGTGKTFALRAARAAWEEGGLAVLGGAVSRRAARELADGSGIASTSVAALLHRLRLGAEPLPPRAVVVVDEAGMLPTRDLAEVLRHVVAADGKLVLSGDHRQLPELEAGGCFRGLVYRLPAIVLEENRRQHAAWERQALRELRHGDVAVAMRAYREQGRVTLARDAAELRRRLIADWWDSGGSPEAVMIALRRGDVRVLNRLARRRMVEAGLVSGAELDCAGARFAAGDAVVLRLNDRRLEIANGDRGFVRRVTGSGVVIALGGREVEVGPDYLSRTTAYGDPVLAHGYAVTGHVAQGLTAEHALVLGTDELYREWAYTAMSRGRQSNRLYVVGAIPRLRDEIAPNPRLDPEANLISALRRSRGQVMAHDVGELLDPAVQRRLRGICEERARIVSELDRKPTARRWWRRQIEPTGRRALLEQRLAELREEEREVQAGPRRAADPPREFGASLER